MSGDDTLDELTDRVDRHPADRYPVQHATAQFHLGVALIRRGEPAEAATALEAAARLFDERLPVEHAMATNMLGVARRDSGDGASAAAAFGRASEMFGRAERPAEEAAALHNLGLVERDQGHSHSSIDRFERARALFERVGAHPQSAEATRELGVTLLNAGELDRSIETLRDAVAGAERTGDLASLGTAANALGLAQLAAGDHDDAVDSFSRAAGAHPRGVRPEGYAMAKANLALAHERQGAIPRARMAARQALGVSGPPEAVVAQARGTLERLGHGAGDLMEVLHDEAQDRWEAVMREEVVWWVDAEAGDRRQQLVAWMEGVAARPAAKERLAEVWLGLALELPPEAFERLIASLLDALDEHDIGVVEVVRPTVSRAMAFFPVPQWLRLKDTFNQLAGELGQEPEWG